MDLNQLYFDHQLLLIRAGDSVSHTNRHQCETGASQVAARIGCVQRELGAGAAVAWERLGAGALRHQGCAA